MFLIKPFCYMTKKSRLKLKYLESFWREIKPFLIIFKRLSATKNCLKPESAPLNDHTWKKAKKQPSEVFYKKGIPKNFSKFPGLFFNTFAGLGPSTLLKKRPWHRCFPVNFKKFLRTGPLLLKVYTWFFVPKNDA